MIKQDVFYDELLNQPIESGEVITDFLKELESFSAQFDFLGSVRHEEYREFGSVENEYYIKNIHNMSPIDLIPTIKAIEEHMKEFSKEKGIYRFYLSTRILFE